MSHASWKVNMDLKNQCTKLAILDNCKLNQKQEVSLNDRTKINQMDDGLEWQQVQWSICSNHTLKGSSDGRFYPWSMPGKQCEAFGVLKEFGLQSPLGISTVCKTCFQIVLEWMRSYLSIHSKNGHSSPIQPNKAADQSKCMMKQECGAPNILKKGYDEKCIV